jgi:hypothetical protein
MGPDGQPLPLPTAGQVREYLARYMEEHHSELSPGDDAAFSTVRDVLYDAEEAEES